MEIPVPLPLSQRRDPAGERHSVKLSLAGDMMVCYSTAVLHKGPDPILRFYF